MESTNDGKKKKINCEHDDTDSTDLYLTCPSPLLFLFFFTFRYLPHIIVIASVIVYIHIYMSSTPHYLVHCTTILIILFIHPATCSLFGLFSNPAINQGKISLSLPLISKFFSLNFMHCEASFFLLTKINAIIIDVVWLNANSTSIAHTSNDVPAIMYDENVQPAPNITQPGRSGLRGILYERNETCSRDNSSLALFFNAEYTQQLPRIALVKAGGPCTFVQKIRIAQDQEGAVGVIVYDENPPLENDYVDDIMVITTNDNECNSLSFCSTCSAHPSVDIVYLHRVYQPTRESPYQRTTWTQG